MSGDYIAEGTTCTADAGNLLVATAWTAL